MKKINFFWRTSLFVLLLVGVFIYSCTKEQPPTSTVPDALVNHRTWSGVTYLRPKVKFKHSGCAICPCTSTGCDCPLGLCVSFKWIMSMADSADIANGLGNPYVGIQGDSLHMIFDRDAAIDGNIPIDIDYDIGTAAATAFGYDTVKIVHGTYKVSFADYPTYGEATFRIIAN